ncbi:MAG: discoidin domain-containing protein [Planctomycetia bacterium]
MNSRMSMAARSVAAMATLLSLGGLGRAELPPADLLRDRVAAIVAEAGLSGEADAFTKELLASEDWQHELLDSGPVAKPAETIRYLHAIWMFDPNVATDPINRGMATACALEGPGKPYGIDGMVARYAFFRDAWSEGLLNDLFGGLSVFDRRYLAAGVQYDEINAIESMRYQLEKMSLPADRYPGACWYAAYQVTNPFGDSIHGPHYYQPFRDCWGSAAETVRRVGGVCGALSNFGAAAAIANGIPAMTMGEPGHCAYTVMVRPQEWVPSYSLSWSRGLHHAFHGDSWLWHVYNTKAHASTAGARRSGDLRRLAERSMADGKPEEALAALRQARTEHPLDYENWLVSAKLLTATKAPSTAWQELHDDVLARLLPDFGEVAWTFLRDHVYPTILPAGDDAADRRQEMLLAFHRALKGWGADRWDLTSTIAQQMTMVSKDVLQQDAFTASVFKTHADQATLAPCVLEAQFNACGNDGARKQSFIRAITAGLVEDSSDDSTETTVVLARRLLPEAAASGDKETFQFLGRLASRGYAACAVAVEPFPGQLLSAGGTFSIAAAGNRFDDPSQHWGVIEEHGGYFHTDAKPAHATIRLGNFGRLSGVVILHGHHIGRLSGAVLQTSLDGENWKTVHTFTNPNPLERIDLQDRGIEAGFVRVLQENGPHLHFSRFLVYGEKRN